MIQTNFSNSICIRMSLQLELKNRAIRCHAVVCKETSFQRQKLAELWFISRLSLEEPALLLLT